MKPDPIELELFRHLLVSIAEEMGAVLRKTLLKCERPDARQIHSSQMHSNLMRSK